jgi:hypothetical protein
MKNKTISISEDMFARLKEVENASGLIDCLLRSHFDSLKPVAKETLEEERMRILDETNKKIELVEKEIQKIEQTEAEKEADLILAEEKRGSRLADLINRVREDLGIEITQDQAEDYFKRFEAGDFDYFKFLAELEKNESQP